MHSELQHCNTAIHTTGIKNPGCLNLQFVIVAISAFGFGTIVDFRSIVVPALTMSSKPEVANPVGGEPLAKLRSNLWSTSTLEAGLRAIDAQQCKVEHDEQVRAWAAELKAWG